MTLLGWLFALWTVDALLEAEAREHEELVRIRERLDDIAINTSGLPGLDEPDAWRRELPPWPGAIRPCPSRDQGSWTAALADEEAGPDDSSPGDAGAWPEEEALFPQAVEIVSESGLPSAAKLGSRLQIDRPQARRLLDRMYREGFIHVAPGFFE